MLLSAGKINTNQSEFLDFIRGGAAILVLIAHCQQIFINPYWFPHKELGVSLPLVLYRHLGSLGVMLFFVLSGFLIYLSIANNISSNNNKFDVRLFFVSRLVRLYPPLLIATVISLVVYLLLWILGLNSSGEFATGRELYLAREELSVNWSDIFGSLFFLNTIVDQYRTPLINGPLWSLAHEFWFYVLCAATVLVYMSVRRLWVIFLVFTFLFFNVNEFFWYGFFVWVAGFVAAWMWSFWHLKVVRLSAYIISVILFLFWCFALNESSSSYFYNNRHKFLFGLFFAFAMPCFLNWTMLLGYIRRCRLCLVVGRVSPFAYTLYLIHFPIMLFSFILSNKFVDGGFLLLVAQIVFSMSVVIVLAFVIGGQVENKHRLQVGKGKVLSVLSETQKKLILSIVTIKRR